MISRDGLEVTLATPPLQRYAHDAASAICRFRRRCFALRYDIDDYTYEGDMRASDMLRC